VWSMSRVAALPERSVRMIHSHARCDNCEGVLVPEGDREFVDEDYVIERGWITLSWQTDDDRRPADFCSWRCVSVFAGVRDGSKQR
jgi:hypothetical protein